MAYELIWEPRGVYRRYHGDVSIEERLESFERICADPRFDGLRWTITDYLGVAAYEVTRHATKEIAAMHVGPLLTNPRLRIAAVATRPDVVAAIREFQALGFTSAPYRLFETPADARRWVARA